MALFVGREEDVTSKFEARSALETLMACEEPVERWTADDLRFCNFNLREAQGFLMHLDAFYIYFI